VSMVGEGATPPWPGAAAGTCMFQSTLP